MYGTSKFLDHLTLLFQIMVTHHYVPSMMGEGKVVCIRKKGKDLSQCSSYTPITLCSVIDKLFEKNLLQYLTTVGFSKWCRVQNAHAIILEILEHHHKIKKQLFVCGVNISKEFDSMLHSHAFLSLLHSGMKPFIGHCLAGWYGKSSVSIFPEGNFKTEFIYVVELNKGHLLAPSYLITQLDQPHGSYPHM